MKLKCPSCRNVMTLDAAVSETTVLCVQCSAMLRVPKQAVAAVTTTSSASAPAANDANTFADKKVADKVKSSTPAHAEIDDDVPMPRRRRPDDAPAKSSNTLPVLLIVGGVVVMVLLICVVPVGLGALQFFLVARHVDKDMQLVVLNDPDFFPPGFEDNNVNFRPPVDDNPVLLQVDGLNEFIEQNLKPNDQVGQLAPDSTLWETIGMAVRDNRIASSLLHNGHLGTVEFRELGPDNGVLIGFFVSSPDNRFVHYLQPIFLTPKGEKAGKSYGTPARRVVCLKAKKGYAVGALHVRSGDSLNGLSIRFMRVRGQKLNPQDSYDSIRVGGVGENPGARVDGFTGIIIGIKGRALAEANITPKGSVTALGTVSIP
jgi:ribosomal protein S27E